MSQGRNPWSDLGCREALQLAGRYFLRAVRDPGDAEAREGMTWAATLAGIAFGNAGVHLPHAMSYAVSGLVRGFRMPGYPEGEPLVPHGISVAVSARADEPPRRREGEAEAAAEGWFVHVFVDRESRRPAAIPDRLRAALARLVIG
jgi:hypothetical protein